MIGVVLHLYYMPLIVVLLIGFVVAIIDTDSWPMIIALFLCAFGLLIRWLP